MTIRSFVCAAGAAAALATAASPAAGGPPPEPTKQILWVEGAKNAYPRWSKDGARILYESNRTGK